jgi:hypothetical protein
MSTNNKAIRVIERKLQLEIVVPAEPKDLTDKVLKRLNASDARFAAKATEVCEDGSHILVKVRIRDQGLTQKTLEDLAHELGLGFCDATNTDTAS